MIFVKWTVYYVLATVVVEQVDARVAGNGSCNITGANMSVITFFHHRHNAYDAYHLCQSNSFNSAEFGYLHETKLSLKNINYY